MIFGRFSALKFNNFINLIISSRVETIAKLVLDRAILFVASDLKPRI